MTSISSDSERCDMDDYRAVSERAFTYSPRSFIVTIYLEELSSGPQSHTHDELWLFIMTRNPMDVLHKTYDKSMWKCLTYAHTCIQCLEAKIRKDVRANESNG